MSQNFGNLKFYLRSSLNYRDIEQQKTDLKKENDFYSLINKKRKRHISNKNYKIMKCPSCASSSLRNFYKHIHENKNQKMRKFEENNQQMQELKYQLENKVISSPKKYLFPSKNANIINKNESNDNQDILKNNITISKINNDIGEQNKPIGNKKKKTKSQKISMVCETKRVNKEIGKGNSRKIKKDDGDEDEKFFYQNDDLSEDEKSKNDKQNIIECKLVKVSEKKKKVVKPKKSKKIIIQVERVIAPQI
jgi:hypothetical protein